MAIETAVPVHVHSRNNRDLVATPGALTRVDWTRKERGQNALRTFGLFFALTCISVIVPVAHYILVPSLFLASFVMAIDKFGREQSFEGGKGTCPKCGGEVIFQKSKLTNRLTDVCKTCGDDLEILVLQESP